MASLPLDTLLLHPKQYAFNTNTTFRGLTLTENGQGWNIVVRAFDSENQAVYAMTQAEEPAEGLLRLLEALATPQGANLWHHDRYYKGND